MCIRDSLYAAHSVGGHRRFELSEAILRVMEVGNRLIQRVGWIILEHALEVAEGKGGSLKKLGRFSGLQTDGILNLSLIHI